MAKGVSGSTIKSWFQYRCERKTRYETLDPAALAAAQVAKDDREQAWAILGVDYEARVLDRLGARNEVLRPIGKEWSLADRTAIAFLRGEGSARYAAQINLRPKRAEAVLGDAVDLGLRASLADLVERTRTPEGLIFKVVDVKATRAARPFHKAQVAFYALLLEALLEELGVRAVVDGQGEIWRIPDDGDAAGDSHTAEPFRLAPYRRMVEGFLRDTLPAIARQAVEPGRDETFFHVYFKCEQCAYLPHCGRAVSADRPPHLRDVSAVPGLTHESKRTLAGSGVRTVAGLARSGPAIGKADGAGWSLSRRAEKLIARARALAADRVLTGAEEHTFLMPPVTDVGLFLSADHDPVDDGLVALGYLRSAAKGRRAHVEGCWQSNANLSPVWP